MIPVTFISQRFMLNAAQYRIQVSLFPLNIVDTFYLAIHLHVYYNIYYYYYYYYYYHYHYCFYRNHYYYHIITW